MKDLLTISLSKGSCVLLRHFLVFAYKFPLIKWHLVKTLYISAMVPKHEKRIPILLTLQNCLMN